MDPVGGSYAIEKLTDEIEAGAQEYISRIDAIGGMLRAIETGYMQREIQKSAYEYQQAVERGEQVVVGVNRFQAEEERPDSDAANRSGNRARAGRRACRRCAPAAMPRAPRAAVAEVERRARGSENLMPAILAAVEAYATVGEISDALRRVFGEYQESVVI